jgi:hypothetical protein
MPLTRIEPLVGLEIRDRAKQRGLAAARRSDGGDELAPRDCYSACKIGSRLTVLILPVIGSQARAAQLQEGDRRIIIRDLRLEPVRPPLPPDSATDPRRGQPSVLLAMLEVVLRDRGRRGWDWQLEINPEIP